MADIMFLVLTVVISVVVGGFISYALVKEEERRDD